MTPETTEQAVRRLRSELSLEERLADTCPGCGQHTVVDGTCTGCGKRKHGDEVFVGETRIA